MHQNRPTPEFMDEANEKHGSSARKKKNPGDFWELRLYVAGQTARAMTAFANLKKICETYMAGRYHIEVIDLLESPGLADGDQILAVPTLVRKLPEPIRKIIGDLSNTERVLVGLDLRPVKAQPSAASQSPAFE